MATRKQRASRTIKKVNAKRRAIALADRLSVVRPRNAYAVPYFTRGGGDTEYLISNPNASFVSGEVAIYGRDCKVAKRVRFRLKPNCTKSIRIRPTAPDNAGHSIVSSTAPVVIHLLYLRADDIAVAGGELAGTDNLLTWAPRERSRTYAFGYRAQALGHDSLGGSVFVSNPHGTPMSGRIVFYDQQCSPVAPRAFRVKPGCTAEFPFPAGRVGYGRVQVSAQPAINVLHMAASSRGVAAAELVGEGNRVAAPSEPPKPGTKILFDDTHACRPGVTNDWTEFEAALVSAGYGVAHFTDSSVTLAQLKKYDVFVIATPRSSYSAAEKDAIAGFVDQGGGLLVVQDFGNAPWSVPTREVLNYFGANDDNNFMQDPTNNVGGQQDDVIFDYQRNFLGHPITDGWKYFHVDAASSLSGGTGWTTIVETDDDSVPARRPAVIVRGFGEGRIVAFGDSNTWANHLIENLENKLFGVRCCEWLLYQI